MRKGFIIKHRKIRKKNDSSQSVKTAVEHSEEQFYQKIEKSLKIKRDQIQKVTDCKKINRRKEETGGFHCLFRRCMGG